MDAVHLHLGVFQDDQFVRRGVVTAPRIGEFSKSCQSSLWSLVNEPCPRLRNCKLQLGILDPTCMAQNISKMINRLTQQMDAVNTAVLVDNHSLWVLRCVGW